MSARISSLIESLNAGYIELNRRRRVVRINKQALSLLRVERTDALGKTLEALIPDGRESQHWPALMKLLRSRATDTISIFLPRQYRWIEIRKFPAGDGAGLLLQDVTDRHWLLRREAERSYLKRVFEEAPITVTIMRGQKLVIEYMNRLSRALLGKRKVIGYPIREAFPDVRQRHLFGIVEKVLAKGTPYHGREVFIQWDRDGTGELTNAYFDISYLPIADFDGQVNGVLSIGIDVTDRVRLRRLSRPAGNRSEAAARRGGRGRRTGSLP